MPDQAIAPLQEFARIIEKWRVAANLRSDVEVPRVILSFCDELSSLLPALASRFEALEAERASWRRVAEKLEGEKRLERAAAQELMRTRSR